MKQLLLITLFSALIMVGCIPTEAGFKQLMVNYQGQHIDEFIAKNGTPSGVHARQDGTRQYTFSKSSNVDMGTMTVYQPQMATAYSSTGQAYTVHTSTPVQHDMGSYTSTCNIQIFTDQKGFIITYTSTGVCMADMPKKEPSQQ